MSIIQHQCWTDSQCLKTKQRILQSCDIYQKTQTEKLHKPFKFIPTYLSDTLKASRSRSTVPAVVDLPTPPFPEATTMTCLTPAMGFCLGRPLAICCFCLSCNTLLSTVLWRTTKMRLVGFRKTNFLNTMKNTLKKYSGASYEGLTHVTVK